ncbi:MAG: lytic murein transglycosylase, partial [bacterium]
EYRQWFVNETMIEQGAEKYRQLSDTMTRIEQEYEIPGEYLLAIWGIESRYGNHRYEYDLLSSLTTMAYGHPRSADYFRSELLSLLQIHEELDFSLKDRRGSWAGAMGQPQFLPSTYQNYAVDFTGTGWADIWNSEADILASIANYIAQHGWNTKQGCARSLEENEQAPPGTELITPGDTDQLRFAVTDNFHAIYNYNHSNHYALTVCQLAEAIGEEIKKNQ